ncbi:MAG: hypothetical protein ABIO57_03905 [Candidatus Paceibacterota bacterium]
MKKLLSVIAVLTLIATSFSSCAVGNAALNAYANGYRPGQTIYGPPAQHPFGSVSTHTDPAVAAAQTQHVASVGLGSTY